ncbi:MAG TPA: hypothetical protein VFJ43_05295, partial [Bacteroidia bacterium]|nr:hypothetical protein [Bacteroidia bacterium]
KDSLKNNHTSSSHVGGAGGIQKISVMKLKRLHYEFAGQIGIMKHATVQLSGSSDAIDGFYGIVGEDVFMQWNVMTINFDRMFVLLK